jgi:hypothetical protein
MCENSIIIPTENYLKKGMWGDKKEYIMCIDRNVIIQPFIQLIYANKKSKLYFFLHTIMFFLSLIFFFQSINLIWLFLTTTTTQNISIL